MLLQVSILEGFGGRPFSGVLLFPVLWLVGVHFIVKQSLYPPRPFPTPLMGITEVVSLLSVNKLNARYHNSSWA